ncbi:MAG: hypothetical protein QXS54_11315, partial [Candidatus Methanomethylicaceae archaeon]
EGKRQGTLTKDGRANHSLEPTALRAAAQLGAVGRPNVSKPNARKETQQMNTKYRFLFGLLLLGVIVLFILHNTLSTQARTIPRPQPSPTPEVLPNGWYRYTDKAAGHLLSLNRPLLYISRCRPGIP